VIGADRRQLPSTRMINFTTQHTSIVMSDPQFLSGNQSAISDFIGKFDVRTPAFTMVILTLIADFSIRL
jgi:hypothetical protein